ncbi:hypothetical protein DDE05_17050 [Streptomyces cavourensis]|nr:hypothetical protein DDE05_17050 [Streptomyces cavourensis]
MAVLSARQIQVTALIVALLVVLTGSFAYVAVQREIGLSSQRLQHHMDHLEADIQALKTALGQVSLSGDKGFFPGVRRRLQIEPIGGASVPDVNQYLVYDAVFQSRLRLEMPASLHDDRVELAVFGLSTALQLYSSLAQAPSGSMFPLMLLSKDGRVRMSTPCQGAPAEEDRQRGQVAPCANQRVILNGMLTKLSEADDNVQLTAVRLEGGETAVLAYRLVKPYSNSDVPWVADREWVVVSYFDTEDSLSQRYQGMQGLMGPIITSRVELFDAQGKALSPAPLRTADASPGWSMHRDGTVFRIDGDHGISARYFTPYRHYAEELGPGLAAVGLLVLVSCIATLFFARWYVQRFYEPAKRQIKRIEESDAFGRQVIDAAQLAIVVCTWPEGKILRCNELAIAWFDDLARMRRAVIDWRTSNATAQQEGEQRLTLGDRHIVGKFLATRYEDQDALLCTFRDVSEDVQAHETLEQARQAADESNAAKSEFLATMSHEIRTPLYGVLGMLELLASTPLSQVQQGFIRTIESSSDQLLNVIGDVLDMSKIEAGGLTLHNEPFSAIELTERVVQVHGPKAAGRGIFLHCTIATDVPVTLLGDAGRVRQILNNLVSNAIKFTEIGRVMVALTVETKDAQAVHLRWRVSDTGVGMSETELTHVFEPFYQARSARLGGGGTGLGLAICRKLVKMMGGHIEAISHRNVGSTFLVELPFTPGQSEPAQAEAETLHGLKVYVRAPTQELRDHYRNWVTRWGATCELVSGGDLPSMEAESVLVQVLPEQMSPVPAHMRQVFCTQTGPLHPNPVQQGWQVNCYAIRSIRQAILLSAGRQLVASADTVGYAPEATRQAMDRLGLRILVVEDSVLNQEVLKWQLESLGCEVTLCGSPRRAIELWSDDHFDILLTDANMPELSGREMVSALRERGMKRPAVCVTANAVSELFTPAAAGGLIDAWLAKPVSAQSLKVCLVKVCADRRLLNSAVDPVADPGQSLLDESDADDVPYFVREVFVTAMGGDVMLLRGAAERADSHGLDEILHRVRGGLVMSNSRGLASECARLESSLANEGMSEGVSADLKTFCDALQTMVDAVRNKMATQNSPQPDGTP